MRSLFQSIMLVCLTLSAASQNQPIGTSDSVLIAQGALKANGGFIVAVRDTLNHPWKDSTGLLTIRPADSSLYMRLGSDWTKLAKLTDLSEALTRALRSDNNLSDITDPEAARRSLQLGALATQNTVSVANISGLSGILSSQNLDAVTNAGHKTGNPIESSRYMRVKGAGAPTLIDLNHSPVTSWNEPYDPADTNKIYTITPTHWTENNSVPVLRMRHPLNTFESTETNNRSLNNDFKILPYQFGWAMEYNGVVECWVGEWSIHRGNAYKDVEGKNNGWGGVSWVGDDLDHGGVRLTARNNPAMGINYGEISVEKFDGTPNGNMHFRLPDAGNEYKWTWGARGDSNTSMTLSPQKLMVNPKIETTYIDALSIKTDTINIGTEGYPGIKFKSFMGSLPTNSTLNQLGWLQYNTAGYKNLAGSSGYFTRTDVAADHIFFNGVGTPKPSMILKANGNMALGTFEDEYRLNVASENAITAKFSGRVIGADAIESNEFITLKQLTDSLNALKILRPRIIEISPSIVGDEQPVTRTTPDPEMVYGNFQGSGDGQSKIIAIPHGANCTPIWWNVTPTSKDAGQILFVTADDENILVHYQDAPTIGSGNISFNYSLQVPSKNNAKFF